MHRLSGHNRTEEQTGAFVRSTAVGLRRAGHLFVSATVIIVGLALGGWCEAAASSGESTSSGTSNDAIRLNAGAMVGWRHLRAREGDRNAFSLETPILGASIDGAVRLIGGAGSRVTHRLVGGGHFAPVRWRVSGAGTDGRIAGYHAVGRVSWSVAHRYLPGLSGVVRAGAGVVSEWTGRNPYYTGTRYIGGRMVAGVISEPMDRLKTTLMGGLLPSPWATHSGGSRGETNFALGWTGRGEISWSVTPSVDIDVGYELTGYDVAWRPGDDGAVFRTLDLYHHLTIGAAAAF